MFIKSLKTYKGNKLKGIQVAMKNEMKKYTIADLRTGMQDILAKEA